MPSTSEIIILCSISACFQRPVAKLRHRESAGADTFSPGKPHSSEPGKGNDHIFPVNGVVVMGKRRNIYSNV